jgi:hypothetical protein
MHLQVSNLQSCTVSGNLLSRLVLSDQSDYVSKREFALAPDYYRLTTHL